MIVLKNYQQQALDALRAYLETARFKGAQAAWETLRTESAAAWHGYRPLDGLPDAPFICLRLPTGGGKTLLAAHAVKIAAETFLEREFPLVLWLVPSSTIKDQTLETLRKPGHANHEALRSSFDGRIKVLDIAEFAQLLPQDLKGRACIVVGTIQSPRTENKEIRKVYAHNENLEAHFSGVPEHEPGLDRNDGTDGDGRIRYSFANLLALHRPLVIVDEAHNASTELSNEVMRRIRARCIVEFTATPAADSNVLHNVSASELKAEEMIKLPIRLKEHRSWEEAVHDAVLTRQHLAEVATKEADYIRPIVLYQAEKKNQDVTKDVLLKHLTEQEKIPREKIAVVTGAQKELDGINLFDPACPIDHVITIAALKEGWDCSFAYVFCSVANVHSPTDVEQILGRVLRMPYARRRADEELNRAYAHVVQTGWPHAIRQLHDRLTDMGFEDQEADRFIERQPDIPLEGGGGLERSKTPSLIVSAPAAAIAALPETDRTVVVAQQGPSGSRVTIRKPLSDESLAAFAKALPDAEARKDFLAEHRIFKAQWAAAASPAERGIPFRVPQLCVVQDGELALAEKELFLDAQGWNLLDGERYPAELSENQFDLRERGHEWEIDINAGRLRERIVGAVDQFDLDLVDTGWTDGQLCRWLDQRLRQPDIAQPMLLEHVRRTIAGLTEKRHLKLPALVRARYVLAKVLLERLKQYRRMAFEHGYQETLFGTNARVETTFDFAVDFAHQPYGPHWTYRGSYDFRKHFHAAVGELKDRGEEFDCAQAIDMHAAVRHWVRNLDRREGAFSLPTASDRFYPDFVAELVDGRFLAVEHKGEVYATNDDSKEKRNVGELWQDRSGGKAIFLMTVVERGGPSISQQINERIGQRR